MEKYALTGTPGTGKTSVSKLLNEKVTSLSDYYEEASEGKTNNGEWVVDIEKLNTIFKTSDTKIYEGNFAHKLNNIDKIIVLRCDPSILKERLEERGYKKEKIMENLEAEAIGLIFSESISYVGDFVGLSPSIRGMKVDNNLPIIGTHSLLYKIPSI